MYHTIPLCHGMCKHHAEKKVGRLVHVCRYRLYEYVWHVAVVQSQTAAAVPTESCNIQKKIYHHTHSLVLVQQRFKRSRAGNRHILFVYAIIELKCRKTTLSAKMVSRVWALRQCFTKYFQVLMKWTHQPLWHIWTDGRLAITKTYSAADRLQGIIGL